MSKILFRDFSKKLFVFLVAYLCGAGADADAKIALIITVDGLRPDAVSATNTPNLNSLISRSSYTLNAETIKPSITIPAHASLITGLRPERHNAYLDTWNESMGYIKADTIFCIAKNLGIKTAMFVGKQKLRYLAKPGCVDHFSSGRTPNAGTGEIAAEFSKYFKKQKPELALLHFSEPDLTGHRYGWMTEKYFEALRDVDSSIGEVIDVISATVGYDQALIVVTSDHGGKNKGHAGSYRENLRIPWVAFGDKVKRNHKIKKRLMIYDTAPTVLSALGINPPTDWDGVSIREIFQGN